MVVWLLFVQSVAIDRFVSCTPRTHNNVVLQPKRKYSDYDEDCAEGLVCWYDEDETGDLPPGCAGTPQPGSEYCIDPKAPPYVFPKILKDRTGLDACVGDW